MLTQNAPYIGRIAVRNPYKKRLPQECAYAELINVRWDAEHHACTYEYFIHPPDDRKFFPEDYELERLVGILPDMRLGNTVRFKDRDYFSVIGYKRNSLSTRADMPAEGKIFLDEVTRVALRVRPMSPSYQKACDDFMTTHMFKKIEWDDMYIDATDYDNNVSHGRFMRYDPRFQAFERLRKLSKRKKMHPFTYEAAQ